MNQVFRFLVSVGIFSIIFGSLLIAHPGEIFAQNTQPCTVENAYFSPDGNKLGFIRDPDALPSVSIVIKTQNCAGKSIKLWVISDIKQAPIEATPPTGLDVPISTSEKALVAFNAGDELCYDNTEADFNTALKTLPLADRLTIAKTLEQKLRDAGFGSHWNGGGFTINVDGTVDGYDAWVDNSEEILLYRNNYKWLLLEKFNKADCHYSIRTLAPDSAGKFININPIDGHIFTSNLSYQCLAYQPYATNGAQYTCNTKWKVAGVTTPEKIALAGDCVYKTGDQAGNLIPDCYELLAPIPGLGSSVFFHGGDGSGENFTIGKYITVLTEIIIGAASVAAVIFLIYIGAMMVATGDNPAKKLAMKGKLLNVVIGLAIVLGVYVILDTINPELLNINPTFDKVTLVGEVQEDGSKIEVGYTKTFEPNNACPGQVGKESETCVVFDSAIQIKPGVGNKSEKSFVEKITQLNTKLTQQGIYWRVTEAWQPTRTHKAKCHPLGTCIDANHTNTPTHQQIKQFIATAESVGLCAIYEVKTEAEKSTLVSNGIPTQHIKNYGSWISGSHYSVYGGSCK